MAGYATELKEQAAIAMAGMMEGQSRGGIPGGHASGGHRRGHFQRRHRPDSRKAGSTSACWTPEESDMGLKGGQ